MKNGSLCARVTFGCDTLRSPANSPPLTEKSTGFARFAPEMRDSQLVGPQRLTEVVKESSSMARWVVYLSQSVEEGVQLVLRYPAAFDQHARLLHELSEQHIQHNPLAFTQLVSHLLADTQLPFYSVELPTVLSCLRSHGVEEQSLISIKEQALRLGVLFGSG